MGLQTAEFVVCTWRPLILFLFLTAGYRILARQTRIVPAGKQCHTRQCHLEKLPFSLFFLFCFFFWLNHTSRSFRKCNVCPAGSIWRSQAPRDFFKLRHRSSGSAVSQAGAAALVRELQCGGGRKAGRRGPRKTKRGGRLIRASVLEQDVHAFLTPCAASQSQRRLPLSVPISNIAAILRRQKQKVLKGIK